MRELSCRCLKSLHRGDWREEREMSTGKVKVVPQYILPASRATQSACRRSSITAPSWTRPMIQVLPQHILPARMATQSAYRCSSITAPSWTRPIMKVLPQHLLPSSLATQNACHCSSITAQIAQRQQTMGRGLFISPVTMAISSAWKLCLTVARSM